MHEVGLHTYVHTSTGGRDRNLCSFFPIIKGLDLPTHLHEKIHNNGNEYAMDGREELYICYVGLPVPLLHTKQNLFSGPTIH